MKHLAAYLLLSLSGGSPSQSDVKKLLSSVGIEADDERLEKLFSELEGKDINEVPLFSRHRLMCQLIQTGSGKLSSVPSGGAGGAAPAAAGGAAAAGGEAAPAEEETKEEEKEESDEDVCLHCVILEANFLDGFRFVRLGLLECRLDHLYGHVVNILRRFSKGSFSTLVPCVYSLMSFPHQPWLSTHLPSFDNSRELLPIWYVVLSLVVLLDDRSHRPLHSLAGIPR